MHKYVACDGGYFDTQPVGGSVGHGKHEVASPQSFCSITFITFINAKKKTLRIKNGTNTVNKDLNYKLNHSV